MNFYYHYYFYCYFQKIFCYCSTISNFRYREYKDIALISLANLLHKHRYSTDAAVLLHAALIIDQSQAITHYSLANVYAVSYIAMQLF